MSIMGAVATLVLVLFSAMIRSGDENKSKLYEQTHFSAEDDAVRRPVSIPEDVLTILKKDELVRRELETEHIISEGLPPSWFSASAVHLNSNPRPDLIIMAIGPLRGSNVTTFWVFRSTHHGYSLVLTASEHDLEIKKTHSNGYRDVELTAITGSQISSVLCRFDGKRYREYRSKSEPIR